MKTHAVIGDIGPTRATVLAIGEEGELYADWCHRYDVRIVEADGVEVGERIWLAS